MANDEPPTKKPKSREPKSGKKLTDKTLPKGKKRNVKSVVPAENDSNLEIAPGSNVESSNLDADPIIPDIDTDQEEAILDGDDDENVPESSPQNKSNDNTNLVNQFPHRESVQSESTSSLPAIAPPTAISLFQNPQVSEALLRQLVELLQAKSDQKQEALTDEEKRFATLDKAFKTTTPTRIYQESEKLQGRQNFTTWMEAMMIDLRGYSLSAFVEAPLAEGIVEISPMRRVALDAQTLQFIHLALTKSIQFTVADAKTAFEAMELIKKHHGNDKHHDMIEIDRKWSYLKFFPTYDKNRFVYEFNQLVKRFSEHGVILADSYLVIAFLQRMQGIFNSSGPVAVFYRQLRAENLDKINLQTLQARFVQQNFHEKGEDKSSSTKRKHDGSKIEAKIKLDDNTRRSFNTSNASTSKDGKHNEKSRKTFEKSSSTPESGGVNIKSKPLHEKYTPEQLERLKTMSQEEKKKFRCSKCNDYFHSSQECPNKGKLCYTCKYYGHEARTCKYANSKCYSLKIEDFTQDLTCVLDSGANYTFIRDKNLLLDFKMHSSPMLVQTIEEKLVVQLQSIGEGVLVIMLQFKSKQTVLRFKNVQCVPSARHDVISVSHFNEQFHTSCILNVKSGFITSRRLKSKIASIQVDQRIFWLTCKVPHISNSGNFMNVNLSIF